MPSAPPTKVLPGPVLPSDKKGTDSPEIELAKEGSFLKKWIPFALFYGFLSFSWPFVTESRLHILITLFCWLSFFAASFPIYHFARAFFAHLTPAKQNECLNRVVSIIFNVMTGVPSYLAWYNILPGYLPTFDQLTEGRTSMMDIFACITIGYSLYDFPTLAHTYGRGAALIQLHHCVEMVIVSGYPSSPVASVYLLGGGLMQISSAMIHVERVMTISKVTHGVFSRVWRWALIVNWAHSRLLVFPWMMWFCLHAYPIGYLHGFLIFVGTGLTIMNAQWLWKIFHIKSLAY